MSLSRKVIRIAGTARGVERWLLVILMLLAFGRGTWALGGKSFWWDESLSLHRAQASVGSVFSNEIILTDAIHTVATIDNHPPLYFLLLWVALRLFGQTEFALRFLSVLAIVLIVPLLYVTGRRLIGERAGLAAAALGALSPMYLWYGQEARMYALLAFFSLLSFYLFGRAFLSPSERSTFRSQWRWIVAYVLASACVMFTHYLGLLLIAFELLALLLRFLRRRGTRRMLVPAIASVLALSLSLLAYALNILPSFTGRAGFRFLPLPDLLRDLLNSFSLGLSVDVGNWYVVLVDLIFLLFLVLGFVRLVRPGAPASWRCAALLLAGYLLIPIALVYLVSYVRPAYMNSRHLILITPAFYLLVAAGLAMVGGDSRTRRGRTLGIALLGWLLVIGGVSYSTYNYFNDPTYDKDHHREWGAYLREHVRPGDVVVVDPPHIAELYHYYADIGAPWIGLPLLTGSYQETAAELEDLLRRYDRVWLAVSRTPPWGDRHSFPEEWLNENAFRVDYKGFHSYASAVLAACYLPDWPSVQRLPDDAQPVEVRYSPSLGLAGYRIVSPPQPGWLLHVELFWSVDQLGPEEASVSLRLVDDEGQLWGQGEHCPFNGLYPMWQWQPGVLLRDEHELLIQPGAPPGTYQLELVLVSRPTQEGCFGARGDPILPLAASAQRQRGEGVLLGSVDVQRAPTPASQDELGIERRHRVRFDGLELLGASLASSELKPGERLGVTLYWQARESSLPDGQFHLRLVDSFGRTWEEAVVHPAGSAYPTDRWVAGDRFKGQFGLWLPEDAPGGRYRVELVPEPPLHQTGVWAALRRWFRSEDAGVRLGTFDVQAELPSQASVPAKPIPIPTDLDVSHPMLATLGDRVRFLGYDLDSDSVRAGEVLSFTLYWQALRPMDTSYSVFTHLLGPSNQLIGQKDSVPQGGSRPTTSWQTGEIVADTYAFTINPDAPPGNYPIEVGMYHLETSKRLPVMDANGQPVPDDRILLCEVTVLPALASTPTAPW